MSSTNLGMFLFLPESFILEFSIASPAIDNSGSAERRKDKFVMRACVYCIFLWTAQGLFGRVNWDMQFKTVLTGCGQRG